MKFCCWLSTPISTPRGAGLLRMLVALLGLFFAANALVYYPGLVSWDLPWMLSEGLNMRTTGYQSVLYPIFLGVSQLLFHSIFGVVVLQNILTLGVIAYALKLLQKLQLPRWVLLLFFAFIVCSPVVVGYANYYQRSVVSGLVNAWLMLLFFKLVYFKVYNQESPSRAEAWGFGLLLFFSAILRMENILLVMGAVVVLFGYGLLSRRFIIHTLALTAPFAVAYYALLCPAVKIKNSSCLYLTTNVVNGVGVAVADGWITKDSGAFLSAIEKVIPIGLYQKSWTPYNIDYYLQYVNQNPEHEPKNLKDALNFGLMYIRTLLHRPDAFLGYRLSNFIAALGATSAEGRVAYINDLAVEENAYFHNLTYWPSILRGHNLMRNPLRWPPWMHFIEQRFSARCVGGSAWNAVPQMILVLFAVSILGKPITAWVCAVFSLRLLALFFFMPSSNFFYLYDLYLLGAMVPFMWWAEYKISKQGFF